MTDYNALEDLSVESVESAHDRATAIDGVKGVVIVSGLLSHVSGIDSVDVAALESEFGVAFEAE
jgi:hypothetical protein